MKRQNIKDMIGFFAGTILLVVGFFFLIKQHTIISQAKPIEATVVLNEMRKSECKVCPDYRVFEYRYTVDQIVYTNRNTEPLDNLAYDDERYLLRKKGDKITAYYDPRNPAYAFLVREYSFIPYFFVLIASLSFWGTFWYMLRTKPQVPKQMGDNKQKFVLHPVPIKKKMFTFLIAFLIFAGANLFSLTNYFINEWNPSLLAYVVAIASIGIFCGFLYHVFSNALFVLILKDVVIWMDLSHIQLGEVINIEAQHAIKRPVKVKKASIGIIARRADIQSWPKVYTDWKSGMENYSVPGGEIINLSSQFQIPQELKRKNLLRRYNRSLNPSLLIWMIEYKLQLKFLSDFKTTVFPEH